MADRDELARVIGLGGDCYESADAILASDWLARVRAEEREAGAKVEREACAQVGYATCAQTRHVSLGNNVAAAIRERNQ